MDKPPRGPAWGLFKTIDFQSIYNKLSRTRGVLRSFAIGNFNLDDQLEIERRLLDRVEQGLDGIVWISMIEHLHGEG